ncbi:MAG: DNA mismatch repair endonuclease MutL [Nitrospirota bacterium]
MPRVTVLSDALKNKIAAGEVVERPASVLRELLENALDARARLLEVDVQGAGKRLIRVSDDGEGMEREDALLALKRHATSKIESEEDLLSIATMGFRGEALPSIASVSRLTLATAPRGASPGVRIEAEGGEVREVREAPAHGTSVEVRDLFFNTPARKKFLKRDATELMHVIETATALALSHPEVGLTLRAEGKETLLLARAADLRERLSQVYGTEFVSELLMVQRERAGLSLTGFVSPPGKFREGRSHQHLFINRRPVRNPSVAHALYAAYEGLLPRQMHPIFFLHLALDPRVVDVNVHPAKREVRFSDQDGIYRFVRRAVADALRGGGEEGVAEAEEGTAFFPGGLGVAAEPRAAFAPAPGGTGSLPLPLEGQESPPFLYLGETFLAFPDGGGGLFLLDYHAAHERVLFERLLRGMRLERRELLFPEQVTLTASEHLAVLAGREMIGDMGIEVEDFGGSTVLVRTLPEGLEEADVRGVLSDLLGELRRGERPGRSLREALAARLACHAAWRGKRSRVTAEEVSALLGDLGRAENPEHCPHGRPTRVRLAAEDLQRLFGRK